jgi:hypothetical protein
MWEDYLAKDLMGALLTWKPSSIQVSAGHRPGSSIWVASYPLGRHVTVELSASRSCLTETESATTSEMSSQQLRGLSEFTVLSHLGYRCPR